MRVQLHPATDRWMRGDRYGDLIDTKTVRGRKVAIVKMDRSGQTIKVLVEDVIYL